MSETLLRQWELLRAIPRAPSKVTVATLLKKLAEASFKTTKRTIQRELNQLSAVFPLESDDRSIPYGWSWAANAPAFDLPALDATTALSLRMIEQFLPTLMPPTVSETLAPQFRRAQKVLEKYGPEGFDRWTSLVRVVPREMPLLPPKLDSAAVRVIYQALLDARRVEVRYVPRSAEGAADKTYLVNPLGVVARGSIAYLVCTLWKYTDVRHLALHRVRDAVITDEHATRPEGFDLDAYTKSGVFQYPLGNKIQLIADFERGSAAALHETPLSDDQVIETLSDGRVRVQATVGDTAQLEWWLLAFGDLVEVLEPAHLRTRIFNSITKSLENYSRGRLAQPN
ncbi:MAG: WYL domain-containing protein [Proteobacteria bacterium]|nr:WYL domain-containing protein [Pseudomonadota bacterium]